MNDPADRHPHHQCKGELGNVHSTSEFSSERHSMRQRKPQGQSKTQETSKQARQAKASAPEPTGGLCQALVSLICFWSAVAAALAVLSLCLSLGAVYLVYGGGEPFPANDIVQFPHFDISNLELVAEVPSPPGNVAVSSKGRVFFTFHPDGPYTGANVVELRKMNGKSSYYAYPSKNYQRNFTSVLSLRISQNADGSEWLWTLDFGNHGMTTPKITAFDLETNQIVHHYEFPSVIAPLFSMLNDFQVDTRRQAIYIADSGIIIKEGALIVYDIQTQTARRLLAGHHSVTAKNYNININSTECKREIVMYGVFAIRPNVDSIVLSRDGTWLYYASVNDPELFRIYVADLHDTTLSQEDLGARVQVFANKTLSDGMTIDDAGNLYYGDMEQSAIVQINTKFPEPTFETLLQSEELLRWPDGFSFGPDGYLYVACSALQHVLGLSTAHTKEHAPYQIFRFRPGFSASAGH